MRFQTGMSKIEGRGGRRYLPYAFTEQGVAMLSSVLKSKRAVQVNIAIDESLCETGRCYLLIKSLPINWRNLSKR